MYKRYFYKYIYYVEYNVIFKKYWEVCFFVSVVVVIIVFICMCRLCVLFKLVIFDLWLIIGKF